MKDRSKLTCHSSRSRMFIPLQMLRVRVSSRPSSSSSSADGRKVSDRRPLNFTSNDKEVNGAGLIAVQTWRTRNGRKHVRSLGSFLKICTNDLQLNHWLFTALRVFLSSWFVLTNYGYLSANYYQVTFFLYGLIKWNQLILTLKRTLQFVLFQCQSRCSVILF